MAVRCGRPRLLPLVVALLLPQHTAGSAAAAACANATGITLFEPSGGEDVGRTFDVSFSLPLPARPGTVKLIWDSPDDDTSPHVITMSPAQHVAGEHGFTMERLSVAAIEVGEVADVSSSGENGQPRDLLRGSVYTVTLQAELLDGCNQTSSSERTVRRYDMLWIFGVGASIVSSVGSTVGMIIQKCAITRNENRIARGGKAAYSCQGWLCALDWWVGFVFMVIIPLPFDMIAMALCGQSLNAPLGAVTVLMNQIIAPCALKGEKLTRLDWVATFLMIFGVGLSTAFGTHSSLAYSLDDLLELFTNPTFVVCAAILWLAMIFPSLWVVRHVPSWSVGRMHLFYAFLAAAFGSQQNIVLKATSEMLEGLFAGDTEAWERPWAYVFILMTGCGAGLQLSNLNKGLGISTAVKYLPVYNAGLIVLSTFFGMIYYKEYQDFTTEGIIMFPVGVMFVLFGVLLLTCQGESPDGEKEASGRVVPEEAPLAEGEQAVLAGGDGEEPAVEGADRKWSEAALVGPAEPEGGGGGGGDGGGDGSQPLSPDGVGDKLLHDKLLQLAPTSSGQLAPSGPAGAASDTDAPAPEPSSLPPLSPPGKKLPPLNPPLPSSPGRDTAVGSFRPVRLRPPELPPISLPMPGGGKVDSPLA